VKVFLSHLHASFIARSQTSTKSLISFIIWRRILLVCKISFIGQAVSFR